MNTTTTQEQEQDIEAEEATFDPVTCSMSDLVEAIQRHELSGNKERAAFLLGIEHCRIHFRAATGGRVF